MTESERQKASSEYYSELKKQLDELLKKDTELLKISEKIRNNKANFEDTAKYSEIVSNYIAKVIQDNVGNISSPMGKEYVCKELLNSYYSSINDVLGKVQVSVDSKNNIHIRPQQAPVPTERIEQIAHSLEDTTVSEDVIKRRSGSPVANVAKSFHDDFIKKNATFRNKAGLKCYITRHSSGNCCKWCSSIAGKYLYKDAPHDVFRRHDNCNCTVTYENGKQRQNVWSKEKWQVKDISKEKYKPVKLNHEQAKAIQQNNLNYSNSLVKDKQAKMREFIKQTGQDRDYFREQNYPKENIQNGLTSTRTRGIISVDESPISELKDILKFKKRLCSNKQMEKSYRKAVEKRFSNGSEIAKKVFNKFIPPNSVADFNYDGVSHYNRTDKKIYLNYSNDLLSSNVSGIIWFHEHGHMIDDLAGKVSTNEDFHVLLTMDYLEYLKNYKLSNNFTNNLDAQKAISKDLRESFEVQGAVSDIMEALSNGKIKGCAGHIQNHPNYWKNSNMIYSEAFAHMFEAQFDKVRYKEIQKYFPNALKKFETLLEEINNDE